MKKFLISFFSFLLAGFPVVTFAAADKLPETMVGHTKVDFLPDSTGSHSLNVNTNQYASTPSIPNFATGSMTIMFWVKITATNILYNSVLRSGRQIADNSSSGTQGWAIGFNGQTGQFMANFSDTDGNQAAPKTCVIGQITPSSGWVHVVFVRNLSGPSVKVVFNGNTGQPCMLDLAGITGSLRTGADIILGDNNFSSYDSKFKIDDLLFYNQAVSDTDIVNYYSSQIVPNSPFGYWEFEEGTGLVANDISVSQSDFTLAANPRTPVWDTDTRSSGVPPSMRTYYGGFAGNEAVFNYTNATGQEMGRTLAPSMQFDRQGVLEVDDNPILKPQLFALSLWFKFSPGAGGGALVQKAYFDSTYRSSYELYLTNNYRLRGRIVLNNGGDFNQEIQAARPVAPNVWHHAVLARSCSGMPTICNLNLYLDNSKGSQQINSTDTIPYTANPLYIGGRDNDVDGIDVGDLGQSHMFRGLIDEVRFYSGATLSDADVTDLYHGKDHDTGLSARWDFSENSGLVAYDKTDNHLDTEIYPGGPGGAIWNSDGPVAVDPDTMKNDGYDLFGFESVNLAECVSGIILANSPYRCFISNTKNNNVKIMTSRTFVNNSSGDPVTELAAVFYPPQTMLIGDAYLGNLNPNDFAYWGRNLTQGSQSASSESFWGVGNYIMNPDAQASLSSADYLKYKNKIDNLKNEATPEAGSLDNNAIWNLQAESAATIGTDLNNLAASKFPEGRVWKADNDLDIDDSKTYNGKGTIIVPGDLIIEEGVTIKPRDKSSVLGIIVYGDVVFKGSNKIQASMISLGVNMAFTGMSFDGGDVDLVGSFVAKSFNFGGHSNIRFYYDKSLSNAWPPGFGDLKMPHPSEN